MNKFLGYIIFILLVSTNYSFAETGISGINIPETKCESKVFQNKEESNCSSILKILKIGEDLTKPSKIHKSILDTSNEINIKRRLPVEDEIKEGMIVAFGNKVFSWSDGGKDAGRYHVFGLKRAVNTREAIGVMIPFDSNQKKEGVSVLFRGQTYVLLTNENGRVYKGDRIAVSTQKHGYGTKLNDEDYYIGIAQEDESNGRVLMLLQINKYKINLKDRLMSATSVLTVDNNNLNVTNVALMNIKSIYSSAKTLSINSEGKISEKQFCLDDICMDKSSLMNIISKSKTAPNSQEVDLPSKKLFSILGFTLDAQKEKKFVISQSSTTKSDSSIKEENDSSKVNINKGEGVRGELPQDVFDGTGFINP